MTSAADSRLAWPELASVTAALTGAAAAVTGAAAVFTAETTVFAGAATEVTDVTVGAAEPLVTACAVASSAFPAPATVAVTAGVRAWPTSAVTEPTVPSAVAAVADAAELTADVTAGTTDPLVTACVMACWAFPASAATVTTAEPGAGPAQHAGQPTADGAGRCRLTTGAGAVPGGNPDTVGGFGETGGCPPPAGLGTFPPGVLKVLEVLAPRLPVRAGSIGGPVGTGCD